MIWPACGQSAPIDVQSKPIPYFQISSYGDQFGKLRYMGGILTWSDSEYYGAISSIRFKSDREEFLAVLDTGHFLSGTIVRNSDGVLSGINSADITPMLDAKGKEPTRKYLMDAESLALRGEVAYVGFEQRHRIETYDLGNLPNARPKAGPAHLIPNSELRSNGGIETLALAPVASPLRGALVAIAEESIDANGNLFAAILEGPLKGEFRVSKYDDFAVTDGAFLPDGDLILLERRFNFPQGVGMRLRRISGADIKPGALVDGEVILDAGMSYQIDNMEGIDAVPMPDGSTHLFIVSDNNHSFLQRNLMLEFKLLD